MADYYVHQLNEAARLDPRGFIGQCEDYYRNQVESTARQLAAVQRERPIVLVNGPSSAGKTTTTGRLRRALEEKHGIHTETISMDDYYRTIGTYEMPFDDENGVDDLESPLCMDLALLTKHLRMLAEGKEISVPAFDFEQRRSLPDAKWLALEPGEMCIIEGIHALSDIVCDGLSGMATGVFLSIDSTLYLDDGTALAPEQLRFMRRAVRDSRFRDTRVARTLGQWRSVRRGERLYITPNRHRAALEIDSYLPYETFVMSAMLEAELAALDEAALEQAGLGTLRRLPGCFAPLDYAPYIPEDALIHEFIG